MSNKIPNRINPLTRKKLNSSQGVESYRLILCTTSVFRVEKELGTSLFIVKDPPPPPPLELWQKCNHRIGE